jgi:hypothetical protein
MSKRIFELNKPRHSAIIVGTEEHTMDKDYVEDLEKLVQKLVPIYDRYYDLIGAPKPPLEKQVVLKATRSIPALFKPK